MPTHEGSCAPAPDSKSRNATTAAAARQIRTRRRTASEFHDPVVGHGDLRYCVDKLWGMTDPATRGDSHIEMPENARSLAELEAVELKPFAELIGRGLGRVFCTNHCHYPALEAEKIPATLSRKIVSGLLREKLGNLHEEPALLAATPGDFRNSRTDAQKCQTNAQESKLHAAVT
jgi:hypothetical protein